MLQSATGLPTDKEVIGYVSASLDAMELTNAPALEKGGVGSEPCYVTTAARVGAPVVVAKTVQRVGKAPPATSAKTSKKKKKLNKKKKLLAAAQACALQAGEPGPGGGSKKKKAKKKKGKKKGSKK